jgi:hypothetical protein
MAVRLRYLAHDLEVPVGQFVIGRTPDCQLSLDDPLVSRRHALLTVHGGGVVVEDLGSRNGVEVNGKRIDRPWPMSDGDRIKIGSQEMTLSGVVERVPAPPRIPAARETRTASAQQTQNVTALVTEDMPDLGEDDGSQPTSVFGVVAYAPENPDRRVNSLSLVGALAEKALAMGRPEEAERLLQRALLETLAKAEQGGEVDADLAAKAAGYAARLAGATGRGAWVDYIFELYTARRATLPAGLVDELYAVVRKVKHTNKAVFRAYTACLRDLASGFGPAERFVQQRIESLERWAP